MRIDFNVLWVDDQPDAIKAQIDAIQRRMEEEGFQFNPALCESPDALADKIGDQVFNDEIDLILVDWDLGMGGKGQDVIEAIRQRVPYKDVVFYSAQTAATELQRLAFEKGVEGVYCSSREDLVNEVVGVFESLVKKVLDLDHARGIVMGATSDIDHMVNECLSEMYDLLDEPDQQEMLHKSLRTISDRMDENAKELARLQAKPSISSLFKSHYVFTANDRLRALTRCLNKKEFERHRGADEYVQAYMKKVVPGRNILGHVVLVPEGRPVAVVTGEGKSISVTEVRELRKMILQIRAEVKGLLAALQAESKSS
jgi:CheY-like chemotaxis protein